MGLMNTDSYTNDLVASLARGGEMLLATHTHTHTHTRCCLLHSNEDGMRRKSSGIRRWVALLSCSTQRQLLEGFLWKLAAAQHQLGLDTRLSRFPQESCEYTGGAALAADNNPSPGAGTASRHHTFPSCLLEARIFCEE